MGIFDFWRRKRRQERRAIPVRASVLNSVDDRQNAAYFTTAQDNSADRICSTQERKRLRAMCRKVFLDNSFALNAARSLALSVYGSGPSLQVKTDDDVLNTAIEQLYKRWRKQTEYDTKFLTAIQALCSDGEAFFRLYQDPYVSVGGWNVELIEAYRVESRTTEMLLPNEYDGILYDDYGHPVEYTLLIVHDNPMYPQPLEWETVSADRMEHLFIPCLANQRRGLPLLQSALQTLASLQKLEDSTLAAAETAAKLSFVLETDLDPTVDLNGQYVTADDGFGAFDTITLPKTNAGLTLPSGFKVSQLKAEQPTTAYSPFKTDCLIGVGAAIGEPRNIVLNDSSSYNYSSARLDAQVFERWSATIQTLCVKILDSHFKTIISAIADSNPATKTLLERYRLDAIPFGWYFAQPTHIDRQKEAAADVMLLKNNCMSLRDYYAKQGRDWRQELEQIAAERRMMAELGITPEDIVTAEQEQQEVVEQ